MAELTKALSAVLPIDKAAGMTSHDVVARVRRTFKPQKVKVGHAGTLDPDATGLLLVCIGPATRLADLLADQGKVYQARFMLGKATSTEDASGGTLLENDSSHVTREMVQETLRGLTGDIEQVPPMVSAVHHKGKRLYELARAGIQVERGARTIRIDSIELLSFEPGAHPEGEMIVACGKGTYIRTLCADLGARLDIGGHMITLRRTRIGMFDVAQALPIESLSPETLVEHAIPAAQATGFLPLRRISDAERIEILHGRPIQAGELENGSAEAEWIRLVDSSEELVALASLDTTAGLLLPKKVLAPGD